MSRIVVTHALRTPIGKFLGAFSGVTAVDLGASVVSDLLRRSRIDAADVAGLVFGHARQAGNGPNPARQVAVRAGIPVRSPAYTINMACASGLKAIEQAAGELRAGNGSVYVAGGMESMSRVPFLLDRMREGYRLGHGEVVDAMYRDGFLCPLAEQLMGETAESLGKRYGIPREAQDRFATESQSKAEKAWASGAFAAEISPVTVPGRKKGSETVVDRDEHPRAGTTIESLAKLPPVFDAVGGAVTAGNSSGITDGAAALVLMEEAEAKRRGLEPLAAIEGFAAAGVDPRVMGIGPVPATHALLAKTGAKLADFDLIELNEAFAAQVIACEMDLRFARERLNVNGGAIALGHPIGCTGARIVVTLLHALRARGLRRGLATLCVSGGMGLSMSFVR
jgi:acetyl-CoA C-acetyltransferase